MTTLFSNDVGFNSATNQISSILQLFSTLLERNQCFHVWFTKLSSSQPLQQQKNIALLKLYRMLYFGRICCILLLYCTLTAILFRKGRCGCIWTSTQKTTVGGRYHENWRPIQISCRCVSDNWNGLLFTWNIRQHHQIDTQTRRQISNDLGAVEIGEGAPSWGVLVLELYWILLIMLYHNKLS